MSAAKPHSPECNCTGCAKKLGKAMSAEIDTLQEWASKNGLLIKDGDSCFSGWTDQELEAFYRTDAVFPSE